jgi:hypothetical protein
MRVNNGLTARTSPSRTAPSGTATADEPRFRTISEWNIVDDALSIDLNEPWSFHAE